MNPQFQANNQINLIVALPAEAKPLIKALGLVRHQPVESLPLYTGTGIRLAVTGTGAAAASLGVDYLYSMIPRGHPVQWLNVGVCGHGSLAVGEPLLADRVIDQRSGRCWSLQSRRPLAACTGPLTCVRTAQSDYQSQMAYDMESAGFIASVSSLDAVESASIMKIVSDNPDHSTQGINAKLVQDLVQQRIRIVGDLIAQLQHHA
ncbi:MAG: hypothetical protein KZQ88_07710 [Candidatus Thiodiazotropha sp. (ex Dulcina madagascariensis)]|nr:hypothetical protein [Candidatus Thiodiazotropha sp. (ex Dulcina madagascariensis)]MCU7926368.1 hypothetical protein [Candidatus Thiodiazotropha sp. (ex Dulcina madagascariensis)]